MTKLLAQELGKSNPQVNISMSDIEKIKEQYFPVTMIAYEEPSINTCLVSSGKVFDNY